MQRPDPQLMAIFADALACETPEARTAVVDRACGDDAELRAAIQALLDAHDEAGDFLKGGESPIDFAAQAENVNGECAGTIIGPYKLLEQIGEGGFGFVFLAEQSAPVRRKVALKIIKPGMDTREVIGRFEAERQALAMMGPSEHRQGPRCRRHRKRSALFCHGAGSRRSDYRLLRPVQSPDP
jgi:hypothetical protein